MFFLDRLHRFASTGLSRRQGGVMHVPFVVTAMGVSTYQIQGQKVRLLNLREEFADSAYLESLRGVPLTVGHPPQKFASGRPELYSRVVGLADDESAYLDPHGRVKHGGLVFEPRTRAKIQNRELHSVSAGYTARLREHSGIWHDERGRPHPYDAIKTHVEVDHICFTQNPRVVKASVLYDEQPIAVWSEAFFSSDSGPGTEKPANPSDSSSITPNLLSESAETMPSNLTPSTSTLVTDSQNAAPASMPPASPGAGTEQPSSGKPPVLGELKISVNDANQDQLSSNPSNSGDKRYTEQEFQDALGIAQKEVEKRFDEKVALAKELHEATKTPLGELLSLQDSDAMLQKACEILEIDTKGRSADFLKGVISAIGKNSSAPHPNSAVHLSDSKAKASAHDRIMASMQKDLERNRKPL